MKKIIALLLLFSFLTPRAFAQMDSGSLQPATNEMVGDTHKDNRVSDNFLVYLISSVLFQYPKVTLLTIPILSASLYSSMEGYYGGSRDVNRVTKLRNISMTFLVYQIDNNAYPPEHSSGCIPYDYLLSSVLSVGENMDFSDPKRNFMHDGCRDKNAKAPFAYRVIKASDGSEKAILSANMENINYGNSAYSIDEIVKNPKLLDEINDSNGKGKYYILVID